MKKRLQKSEYWGAAPFAFHAIYLLTNSMGQGAACVTNRSSARQEIICILWNGKVHYRIYKSRLTVPILNHINVVHSPPQSRFLKTHFNIILSSRPRSSTWSPSLRHPCQNSVRTSPIPHIPTCHMLCPSYFSCAKYYVVQRGLDRWHSWERTTLRDLVGKGEKSDQT